MRYNRYAYPGAERGFVEIGATHVTIYFARTTRPLVARIVGQNQLAADGFPTRIVCDRLVADKYLHAVGSWTVSGCYVSVLTREAPTITEAADSA